MKFTLPGVVSLVLAVALSCSVNAAESPLNTTLQLPPNLANQEMRIIEIQLAPGQASTPHRHNAHVYVFVLEGEVEMQVRGGPLQSLKAGEMFYESPDDIHQVSRNASATAPARFLVHMLKTVDAPVTVPVE